MIGPAKLAGILAEGIASPVGGAGSTEHQQGSAGAGGQQAECRRRGLYDVSGQQGSAGGQQGSAGAGEVARPAVVSLAVVVGMGLNVHGGPPTAAVLDDLAGRRISREELLVAWLYSLDRYAGDRPPAGASWTVAPVVKVPEHKMITSISKQS
jgi:biotin-(acetyl-CoA carboxylase) ligase